MVSSMARFGLLLQLLLVGRAAALMRIGPPRFAPEVRPPRSVASLPGTMPESLPSRRNAGAAARACAPRAAGRVLRRAPSPWMADETNEAAGAVTSTDVADAVKAVVAATLAALLFGSGVWYVRGAEDGFAWFAAYLLEESLSIDNLFVFSLIFSYFQTPVTAQPKVLRYGLLAAVVLRAVFILAGLAVVKQFELALLPCAFILFYSAYGIVAGGDEEEDLSQNAIVRFTRKNIPFTDCYDCDNFFTTGPDGASVATPLLLALVCVELSDVVFAVDSVPAVFGVTTDPFLAFTSNAFAILGLRQLYTLIAEAVESFEYLKYGIAFVLAFIGAKLLAGFADVQVPTSLSLAVVVASLACGVAASLLLPPPGTDTEGGHPDAGTEGGAPDVEAGARAGGMLTGQSEKE